MVHRIERALVVQHDYTNYNDQFQIVCDQLSGLSRYRSEKPLQNLSELIKGYVGL